MVTWRELLDGINWSDIEASAPPLDDGWLDVEFDEGFGGVEGPPFCIWTSDRVYFPACYDGSEWATWVSRNPDTKPCRHIGGG